MNHRNDPNKSAQDKVPLEADTGFQGDFVSQKQKNEDSSYFPQFS
jgi:hypothetical protein